nr:hypothetical protein [Tanacetum cinerariifolium]
MVNTRTDTDLATAVQNALQAMLPQIREEIREEFRTGSGPSNAGGNPTQLLFTRGLNASTSRSLTLLRRRLVDAENWISHMEKIFDVMGCEDAFKTRIHETYKNVSQEIRDQLNAEAEAVQIILTGIDNDIYSTVDACLNACEMWIAIKRLKQ